MTISLENEVSFSSKIEYVHFNEVNEAMISYGTEKPLAYRPRLVDERLQRLLTTFGAVEIRGTKWCGKSWAALAFGESVIHLDDPNVKTLAAADPTLALQGARPTSSTSGKKFPPYGTLLDEQSMQPESAGCSSSRVRPPLPKTQLHTAVRAASRALT